MKIEADPESFRGYSSSTTPPRPGSNSSSAYVRKEECPIALRDGSRDDWAFVYATWLRQMKRCSRFTKCIPNDVFFPAHHRSIERVLMRGATLSIAADPESDVTIWGYIVSEADVVHFLYVKGEFRERGIARRLLSKAGRKLQFSQWTDGANLLLKNYPQAIYNPYAMDAP
jgi:GNAT superfamily N-acetyltransferase